MPMQEALGDIEVLDSLGDLNNLSHELLVFVDILFHSLKASAHDPTVPLFGQLGRSFPHIKGDLGPLEPFSKSFSLMDIFFVATHDFLFDSQLLHHFDGADHKIEVSSELL